jgi:hypothetical protein
MNAADGGAGVLVSGGRYGASVENDQAGSRGLVSALQAPFEQLVFNRGTVGLSGPAAEICHIESRHVSPAPAPATSFRG